MSSRTLQMTDRLYDYLLAASLREPPLLAELRAETAKLPMAGMQISPEQGQFMAFLVETIGARRTVEVGTFTGYSALCVALALPAGGKVVA
ncbi:MAG: SAM-dependent methyltransferase, partial [Dongiaceae bacterium]